MQLLSITGTICKIYIVQTSSWIKVLFMFDVTIFVYLQFFQDWLHFLPYIWSQNIFRSECFLYNFSIIFKWIYVPVANVLHEGNIFHLYGNWGYKKNVGLKFVGIDKYPSWTRPGEETFAMLSFQGFFFQFFEKVPFFLSVGGWMNECP